VEIRNGRVYVNGRSLDEPYLTSRDNSDMDQVYLGEGEYFVLGDNRRGSNDSRNWGSVPEANILGKVWIIYWPLSKWGLLG
jgi:signal peptidase I